MGFNALRRKRTALGWAGMALMMIWTATTAQAQHLYIDVYPSQDNPTNQTLWIFSGGTGGSTAIYGSGIRSSGGNNYHVRDSWKIRGSGGSENSFYTANKPTNEVVSLSPLFSSTNNPIDIESVRSRLYGSPGSYSSIFSTNSIWFNAHATNAPTVTIGNSRPIGWIFMNAGNADEEMGIRNTPPNLVYTTNDVSRWIGSGILDKPIGDFQLTYSPTASYLQYENMGNNAPYFSANNTLRVRIHRRVIPEPKEYALVLGLFALAFVFFRRQFKRNRQL